MIFRYVMLIMRIELDADASKLGEQCNSSSGFNLKVYMAIRVRKDNKTIVCAAKSEPMDGDFYIDDRYHYVLGVELLVLTVCGLDENGAELWEFHKPLKNISEKIAKEEKVLNNLC